MDKDKERNGKEGTSKEDKAIDRHRVEGAGVGKVGEGG